MIRIKPFDVSQLYTNSYDLIIASTGYERRARFVAEQLNDIASTRCIAPAFAHRQVLDYEQNKRLHTRLGFFTEVVSDDQFQDWIRTEVQIAQDKAASKGSCRVLVDTSSMSRFRLASVVDALRFSGGRVLFSVDLVYAVAKYSPPPQSVTPITDFMPVTRAFAGWPLEPSAPSNAIIGLGYEQDQVIGVVENLEPAEVWAFMPQGPDERYIKSVRKANETLWDVVSPDHVVTYPVCGPFSAFVTLESLVYGSLHSGRVVIIPFGPKIFAAIALLVASLHAPTVAVWRVSCGQLEPPVNRLPSGELVGIAAEFSASPNCDDSHMNEITQECLLSAS